MTSLQDYRYKRKYKAEDGQPGGRRKMSGKSGEHLTLQVPVGTQLWDAETGRLLADLSSRVPVIAAGGGGGRARPLCELGSSGPQLASSRPGRRRISFAHRAQTLADVGLLGMPNVGKSTLLSVVSAAENRRITTSPR